MKKNARRHPNTANMQVFDVGRISTGNVSDSPYPIEAWVGGGCYDVTCNN